MSSDLIRIQELLDRLGRGDAGAAEELIGLTVDQLYRRARRILNQDFPREKARGHETASVADRVISRLHRALTRHAARCREKAQENASPAFETGPGAGEAGRPLNPLTTPRHYYAFVNRRIRYVLLDLCRDRNRSVRPLHMGGGSEGGPPSAGVQEPTAPSEDQPPVLAQQAEEQTRLLAAVERLTPAERYLVQLQYFQDYTQEEIATIIGRNQSNVSRKLDAIRVKLLRLLTEEAR